MKRNFQKVTIAKIKRLKVPITTHIFIFPIAPILFLYSTNIKEVFLNQTIPLILYSLGTSIFVFSLLKIILKNNQKAAIITSILLIVFFTYGHIFGLIEENMLFGFQYGRNKIFLPVTTILLMVVVSFIIKVKFDLKTISKFFNIFAILFISISLLNIGNYVLINGLRISEEVVILHEESNQTSNSETKNFPDIYYIILDGYARDSTLKKLYDFDNSNFTNHLRDRGFYVADKSQSNYSLTYLSLTSSLNMKHVTYLAEESERGKFDQNLQFELIRNNEVSRFLKSRGYTIINIGTGWAITNQNPYADQSFYSTQRNEFLKLLFETSALTLLERYQTDAANSILYAFDKLEQIPSIKEPTFTFAHILNPHHPYLFDRSGTILPQTKKGFGSTKEWGKKDKYIDQLIFDNKMILKAIDKILTKSEIPPIIIIQGDHGPASQDQMVIDLNKITKKQFDERMDILNVYYLPNGGNEVLYKTITPVNSFKKILNYYFNTNYKLLEDKSYFSQQKADFKFVIAPSEGD